MYDVVKFEFAKLPFILEMAKKNGDYFSESPVPSGKSSLLQLDFTDEIQRSNLYGSVVTISIVQLNKYIIGGTG